MEKGKKIRLKLNTAAVKHLAFSAKMELNLYFLIRGHVFGFQIWWVDTEHFCETRLKYLPPLHFIFICNSNLWKKTCCLNKTVFCQFCLLLYFCWFVFPFFLIYFFCFVFLNKSVVYKYQIVIQMLYYLQKNV